MGCYDLKQVRDLGFYLQEFNDPKTQDQEHERKLCWYISGTVKSLIVEPSQSSMLGRQKKRIDGATTCMLLNKEATGVTTWSQQFYAGANDEEFAVEQDVEELGESAQFHLLQAAF